MNENDKGQEKKNKDLLLSFNSENILVSRISVENHPYNGSLGIMLYSFSIVNSLQESITIKDILLEYELDGKLYTEDAMNLITSNIYVKERNENKPSIMCLMPNNDSLFLQNWFNIRNKISKDTLLQPGGILSGSAFYLLRKIDMNSLLKIKNINIIISDYFKTRTKIPITLDENIRKSMLRLIDKSFKHVPKSLF